MPAGRLIIVDDEPVVLSLLVAVFQGDPALEVVKCPDGATALAAMEQGGVDVLLTDKNLPDVNGLELARRCKELVPDAEVVVITGYASLDTALAAMELDVFDYIVKPPKDIHDVRRKVGQAFEKQRLARALKARNADLEQALEELREVQAELIQSEKLAGIGTLAAGIAHEISSPLFGVMGLAEAIIEEDDLELVRGYASEIVDYSRSIKDIVVQLSGYSRTAESEYHTTVDLPRVVEDAVKLVVRSLSFDPRCVSIHVARGRGDGLDVASGDLLVNARTSEVQQIFVNLVKNAVEAVLERYGTEEPFRGRVTLRIEQTPKHVQATVTDNGPGIPKDRQSAIFDPFYTTKPPGRGTGLGLNIVYRILTKYRGQITVESAEGEGTAFTVRFPVEAPAAVAP